MNPFDEASSWIWDAPGTAAVAAGLAGAFTGWLSVRGLAARSGARLIPVIVAALSRALAVAFAVLVAVGGPHVEHSTPRPGTVTVAAPTGSLVAADAHISGVGWISRVEWSGGPASAATALEIARAAGRPDLPADALLVAGDALPPSSALDRALARRPGGSPTPDAVRVAVLAGIDADDPAADDRTQPSDRDGDSLRLVTPAGAVEGVGSRVVLEAGGAPFDNAIAILRLEDGRTLNVPLSAGARRAVVALPELPAGEHLLRADLPGRPPAVGFLRVAESPAVVVVADGASRGSPLTAALLAQGLAVTSLEPRQAGHAEFGDADLFVLGAGAAGPALEARIAGRVQGGAGLLVLGGPGEAGLRRHAGGALEALLPITLPPPPPPPAPPAPEPPPPPPPVDPPVSPDRPDVDLRDDGDRDAYRVALLLVVDRSGSMRYERKLRFAQVAALAAARHLATTDRVGVLAFNEEAEWTVPFQDAGDQEGLARHLATLTPDGNTNIYVALRHGFDAIVEEKAAIRHVILFSDGATSFAVFQPMVESAARRGVTLSTIAIGDGADGRLLGLLAGWGGGKKYSATDPRRLPDVVTIDTRVFTVEERARRRAEDAATPRPEGLPHAPDDPSPTEPARPDRPTADDESSSERAEPAPPAVVPLTPRVVAGAGFLAGLEDAAWPPLSAPEEPGRRGGSHVVLAWPGGAPALVLGRSGTARVAVVAADLAAADAGGFVAWEHGGRLLAQLARSLVPPHERSAPGIVAAVIPGADGGARVVLPFAGGGILRLERADGEAGKPPITVIVERIGSGHSAEGWLPDAPDAGVLVGTLVPAGAQAMPRRVVAVVARRPDQELRSPARLAAKAGVPVVTAVPAGRDGPPERRREPRPTLLLACAAALVLLEALARRAL